MIEIIAELEHKVNELINKNEEYKLELEIIREELMQKNSYIHEVEQDNGNLRGELDSLRQHASEKESKINEGVDKLRSIMDRINSSVNAYQN